MPAKPRLILGLLTFSPNEWEGGRIHNLHDFKTALRVFQERGYEELDTARAYGGGTQEGFTREAGWRERGLRVATKIYPLPPITHRRNDIIEQLNRSLSSLGTDCVDILYLHAPDRNTRFTETLQVLDELHRAGKFKRLGLSNFAAFEVAEVVTTCQYNDWVRPTVYQGLYNCLTRSVEAELLPACRRYGLDFIAYAPTAGGFLTGKYASKNELPTDGRFSDRYARGQWSRDRYFQDANFAAVAAIRAVSETHGISMIEIALRWLVHHSQLNLTSGHDGIIIGVSRLEQLGSNIDALESEPLPEDVLTAVDRAWTLAKQETTTYWHGALSYGYSL